MTPPGDRFTLTPRPAEALRALARRDERPSEVCAAESETPAAAVEC